MTELVSFDCKKMIFSKPVLSVLHSKFGSFGGKQFEGINALSSLFKKNKNYLGLNRFILVSKLTKKKIVALGGISNKNLKKLQFLKNNEFAGISYFK